MHVSPYSLNNWDYHVLLNCVLQYFLQDIKHYFHYYYFLKTFFLFLFHHKYFLNNRKRIRTKNLMLHAYKIKFMINNVINLGFFVFKFTIKYIYFN